MILLFFKLCLLALAIAFIRLWLEDCKQAKKSKQIAESYQKIV